MSVTKITYRSDTAAGDDANIGFTSGEGLILTGQGSTNDVTIKNDADADVIKIATGATNVDIVGDVTAATLNADGDTSAGDNAAIGYTASEGLILTGQGSTNDITIKRDDDTAVLEVATGQSNIEVTGGSIFFGTADKGIYLGVTSATAANLLDDYEEGTYTPTIACASAGGYNLAGGQDLLSYTKVGRICHINGRLNIASESGTPNGQITITLPFTVASMTEGEFSHYSFMVIEYQSDDGSVDNVVGWVTGGSNLMNLYSLSDEGAIGNYDHSNVDTAWSVDFTTNIIAA